MSKIFDFVKQVLQGKTIYRILFNWQVKNHCRDLTGEVLDLAGGKYPSYYNYLPNGLKVKKTDLVTCSEASAEIIDFNRTLPLNDKSADNVFLFNAIYIAKDYNSLLKEIYRILKDDGKFFLAIPWVSSEVPEPDDYFRLTYQGLEKSLKQAGWQQVKIIRFGERFSSAANLLHKFWLFSLIRLIIYPISLLLDGFVPKNLKNNQPCPLGYFCICKK